MNLINQMANYYMNNQVQNLTNQLEERLKQTDPQMYQVYQTARQNNVNPNDFLKQLTGNYDEATKKRFKQEAKKFGIAENLINQI